MEATHWLLIGRQSASVNSRMSCLAALMPTVSASFLRLTYLASSGMKV
ncbi:hypothetical protein Barb7_02784 [Bacteroidales bacterium Barb7]|nr:hypothetical protein Barb7_02784 [Bacteroidales bacterium Barb7]